MVQSSKRARKAVPILALVIPIVALMAVTSVAVAMTTNNWLTTYETLKVQPASEVILTVIAMTTSGMWKLCIYHEVKDNKNQSLIAKLYQPENGCVNIEYFGATAVGPHESSNAIRFATYKACPLFTIASVLMVLALIAVAFGYQRHRRIALFIAGITFIIAGLLLLIGLVVYLSAFQSELGEKLRPKNQIEDALVKYEKGYSYILLVIGFLATELTGILTIFYYIYCHQLDWTRKLGSDPSGLNNSVGGGGGNNNPSKNNKSSSDTFTRGHAHASHIHSYHQQNHNYTSKGRSKGIDIYDLNNSSKQHPRNHNHSSNSSSSKVVPHHHPSCNVYWNLDKHVSKKRGHEFDIPFPPPPPPTSYFSLPRDYPTLTSCSDEDGSNNGSLFPPPPPSSSVPIHNNVSSSPPTTHGGGYHHNCSRKRETKQTPI